MRYSDYVLNVLTILTFPGVGRATVVKCFAKKDMSDQEIVDVLLGLQKKKKDEALGEGVKIGGVLTPEYFRTKKGEIRAQLEGFGDAIDGAIARGEEGFPYFYNREKKEKKMNDSDVPVVLFYKGDLSLLSSPARNNYQPIAVIGLLTPSEDIAKAERMVVRRLVEGGAVIVSGLALGCDTIAHEEALLSGGKTVAVLPSPIDDILPKENQELANRILEQGGLLITEYYNKPSGRYEQSSRYVERDRLQALFSSMVVLSASYAPNKEGKDSGSRHAMDKAKDYGIARAVIYNEAKHRGEAMYNLNRKLCEEATSENEQWFYRLESKTYNSSLEEALKKIRERYLGKPTQQELSF